MPPILDPRFDEIAQRLPSIQWAANAGRALPTELSTWTLPVATAQEALAKISSDSWQSWSADRQGALSSYLSLRHESRYRDWNPIAKLAAEKVAAQAPAIASGLAGAGLHERIAVDTVHWDLVGVLTCAAFMDCRPPVNELRLFEIYEAGHLPVGWDLESQRVLAY